MKSKTLFISTLFAAAAMSAGTATGATYTWVGNNSSNFHDGGYAACNKDAEGIWVYSEFGGTNNWQTDTSATFPAISKLFSTLGNQLNTLRFVTPGETITAGSETRTVSTTNKALSVSFNDLLLGGLIVESGATGYSIVQSNNRAFRLGKENDSVAFDGTINEDFTLTGQTIRAYSTQNWAVASGKTMKFNGNVEGNAVFNIMNRDDSNKDTSGTVDFLGNVTAKSLIMGISTVTVHTGKTFRLERIELGDSTANDDKAGKIVVETGAKLLITGSTNDAGDFEANTSGTNSQYKRNSIVLGEWETKGNLDIKGTLLADKAVVFFGDKGGEVTVGENATLAVNGYGLNCTDKTNSTEKLTVKSGAKLILGAFGLKEKSGANNNVDITAATIGTFTSSTVIEKGIQLGAGVTVIDTDRWTLDMSAGTIAKDEVPSTSVVTISGAISGEGGLSFSGSGKTILSGANTFTGGVAIASGTVSVEKANGLGTGAVSVAKGANMIATVTLTGVGTITNNGTITLEKGATFTNEFENAGTLSVTSGTVTFKENATKTLAGEILLNKGSALTNLNAAAGTLLLASGNTLTNATLAGTSLKIGGAAIGENATTLSGTISFVTGNIDLSSVSFYGSNLERTIFDATGVGEAQTKAMLAALNNGQIVTTVEGTWTFTDNKFVFTATNSNMVAWSAGTSKSDSGSWDASNFNGQTVGGSADSASSLIFDAVTNVDTVTIKVKGDVYARLAQVSGDTKYVFEGANSTVNIGTALSVGDGELVVNTAMKVGGEGVALANGGKLTAGVANSLQADIVSLAAGSELIINNIDALGALAESGMEISMTGGSKISFVQGGLSGATKINISGATTAERAAILSLEANQAPNKDEKKYQLGERLEFEANSFITFDVGENSWFDLTGAQITTSGNFTKTGAGTLVLTDQKTLTGKLTIEAGTVALGFADTAAIFGGNITIGQDGTLALIRSNSFSSGAHAATLDVYGRVYIGQDTVYDGDGADIPTQMVNGLTFNLYGGSIEGVKTDDFRLIEAKNMTVNAKGNGNSSMGKFFVELAGTANFNVDEDATLTVNSTFIEAIGGNSYGFTKNGDGKMILAGTQKIADSGISEQFRDFSGKVTVNGGTLEVQGTLGNASEVELTSNTTHLVFNRSAAAALNFNGVISGSGNVDVQAGTIILGENGNITTNGTLMIEKDAALIAESANLSQQTTLGGSLTAQTISGKLTLNEGATIGHSKAINKDVTISGEIDVTGANTLTVAGGANLTFSSTTVTGGDLDFVVKESATVNLTGTTAVSGLSIVGEGKVAGTWDVDSLTLTDAGEKTLGITGDNPHAAIVTVGSGKVAIGADASLNITENSKLTGGEMGLAISGSGTLTNAGTIESSNLTLALSSAQGGTMIDNAATGTIKSTGTSTIGEMAIKNAGTLELGKASITGDVNVANTGTVVGEFNVADNKTLTVSGGRFGKAGETITISGEGGVKLGNNTSVVGKIAINDGRLNAGLSFGVKPNFKGGTIANSQLTGLKLDTGTLTATTISLAGTDSASEKFIDIRNGSMLKGDVTVVAQTIAADSSTTLLMENSIVNGSLALWGVTGDLSNVNVSGVLTLQNHISVDRHNHFVENGVPTGSTVTKDTDYAGVNIINDVSIGGISGAELSFVYTSSGSYTVDGNTTSYKIETVDVDFDLKNVDAIGESYVLYNGSVAFKTEDGTAANWSNISITNTDDTKYTVELDGTTIGNITFAGGTSDLYLDIAQNGIVVKRAGTFVWKDGIENWSDAKWDKTQKNADNLTNQTITSAETTYVTITNAVAGSSLKIDTAAVQVGGLNFRDVINFNFDQDNNAITGKNLNIENSSVVIKNLGANEIGNAIIGKGSTLTIDSVAASGKLSGTQITLAGTLVFNADYNNSSEKLILNGTAAAISVADEKTATLGTATGATATLTKDGAGTLKLSGNSEIANVKVNAGTLNFVDSTTDELNVATLVQAAETTVSVDSKFVKTNVSLGAGAELKLTNTATDQKLNTLILADKATLTAENVALNVGNDTQISSTGTATISANLTQAVDTQSLINTNAGALTIKNLTLANSTAEGQKDASLVKSGVGTLKIENGDLGGTVYLTAGTLSLNDITNLGSIIATAGATLELTGTVSTDANSEIQVANDLTLTFKTANDFTFNGSLLIGGTLKIDQKSAMVTLAGTGNQYKEIEFNKLTFANGFASTAAGTLKVVGSGAQLNVAGTTTGSLGSLNLSKSLTLDLAENADAQFGNLYGSVRSTLTVAGTGSATFAVIDEMAIAIDSSATVKLAAGNLGVITGGTDAMLEKIGADTTLATDVANDGFTGTVKVSEGILGFKQGGAFANAKLEVAGAGEAIIAYDNKSKVAIGAVADATTIAKTLTGNGKLTVANSNELSFEKKELVDGFTGTLALENGVANLKNFSTDAIVQMSSNSKIVLNETFTLKKLEFAFNDTNQIDFSADDANQTLTISDFGYIKNQTTGTEGTLGIRVETGTVEFAKSITEKLNLVAFGSGTLKLLDTDHDIGELSAGFIEGGEAVTVDLTGVTGTNKIETVNLSGATIKLNADTTVGKFVSNSSASVIETVGDMTLSNIDLFTGTVRNTSGTLTLDRDGTTLATTSIVYGFGDTTEGATTLFNIKSDMSQGGATFAGAGTIKINAQDDADVAKTLTLNKANKDFTGTLSLTAGTLKMTESATLGSGNVELASGTTLALAPENNNANVVIGGNVSGEGTIEKTGGSTAFIGGEIAVGEIVLKGGTLAVTKVKTDSTIKFDGTAVFETGKMLNSEGKVVDLDTDTMREINANFNASTNATFSHSSDFGKTTITGAWESGAAPTGVITLAGGGEGSVFDLETNDALVKKTGTGKWTLNKAIGGSLTVVAGTLSVQKFAKVENQTILVNSAGTLEITGLNSGTTKIEGDFYGNGTIRILTATPTELGSLGDASSSLILDIASDVSVKSDLENTINIESSGKLNFAAEADSEFTYNGFLRGETGATVKKTGEGTLVLGAKYDGEVDFSIDAGTVKVTKSLGSSSKGTVTINTGATLEVAGSDGFAKITKKLDGAGTLKFSSGTTTITAKSDFAGTVEIDQGATIVYSSKNYAAGLGTSNITGTGTVRVDYAKANTETEWIATGFAGNLEIKKGTVAITQEKFDVLPADFAIKFTGEVENDATLKLSGTDMVLDDSRFEVADGKTGTLAVDGTATLGGTFGNGVSLRVLDGSALTTSGGEVSANLTIDKGATMTLAAPQTRMARTSTRSNSALLTVNGNLTVAGTLNVETTNPIAMNGGNATFTDSAEVVFTALPENDVFISGEGSVNIDRNASFKLGDGTVLYAAVNEGAGTLLVGEYIESYGPAGMSDFAALINSNQDSDIWRAWRQASSGQDGILRNFSPVSFGALAEMTTSVARASNDLLRQRLEQRRYDRAIPMAMMVGTNTFYANGFGGTRDSGESSGENPNYDLNYFGAQAGFDTILSGQAIAGVNLNCATGKANIHANGGKHESTLIGVGAYGQYMFDELTYLGVGARLGFDSYDTKRRTAFGEVEGETSGFDMGLSATLGRLFVLDSNNGIHFSPYLGLDLDYVTIDSFDETKTNDDTALSVDSFDRISLRGIVGASLTWAPVPEWRFTLDASVRHEFVGHDSDIDATFQSGTYAGKKSTTTAYYANETSLSVGPRVEYRFNNSWAVNAAYAYETDFEEATSHNANIGLSARF